MRLPHLLAAPLAAALVAATPAASQPFDPAPWLADLEQARQVLHEKYANLEWLENERGVKLDPLFDRAAKQLAGARSETEARLLFDRIERRIGDGHVEFDWPRPASPQAAAAAPRTAAGAPDLCGELGYDAGQSSAGTAHALPGYTAVGGANPLPAGLLEAGGAKVGVIRIGVFQPQGYPELCREALRTFSIRQDRPCDDRCQDRIITHAYARLTAALEDRVRQMRAAGAQVLLIDISDNGGGSEWTEAAARIVSPKLLTSERRGFVRGEHWAKQWRELGAALREHAKKAPAADKAKLIGWAVEADAALRQAETPCAAGSTPCYRIGSAGYATGLVGSAPSGTFKGKAWGVHVFSPAQFPYHDSVWTGPLIVLVDQETWSAAEEFAAVLQDNKAAIVLGARTGGAGCGRTYGGTPTKLRNSGATLKVPDCIRFRADGSNEVRGIVPDEVVGLRANDGLPLRARLVAEKLPAAIEKAKVLNGR
jgi:hypothetical protein